MGESWDDRIAAFWADADDRQPERMRRALHALLGERGSDDPRALFERASLHDFLGEEAQAIPLYRAAIESGLDGEFRTQAVIQCASSLRNVADASGAIALLRDIAPDDPLKDDADAFLTLALFDDGKPTAAVRTALRALAPHLAAYGRPVLRYADALVAPARLRNVVVGLLVRDGHVLAEEYAATARHGVFLRVPGGGIRFGETTDAAIRREFREELGAVLDEARPLGVLENIYASGHKQGHEIVHVFGIRSASLETLARDARRPVLDSHTTVGWYPIERLRAGAVPFYPPRALELAESL